MITHKGKGIISKYLIGQTPSYASYIAIGGGAKTKSVLDTFTEEELFAISEKTNLDFEMARFPIVSRGYVYEDGLNKVVLTAELPTAERYEFTEVGIFPAESDGTTGTASSKFLYSFSETEGWQYQSPTSTLTPTIYTAALDKNPDNVETVESNDLDLVGEDMIFIANSDNAAFENQTRVTRKEKPRYLNSSVFCRGDLSDLDTGVTLGVNQSTKGYAKLVNASLAPLDSNTSIDDLRLGFSVLNRYGDADTTAVKRVMIRLDFHTGDGTTEVFASMMVDAADVSAGGLYTFATDRYNVAKISLSQIPKGTGFTWAAVTMVKAYVTVTDSDDVRGSDKFYVALDGLRLENNSGNNPIYGLTGYSPLKTADGIPVIKRKNSSSYIEFRFAVDVA